MNKSLTLEAPTPTNISTKSDPDREKNGTFASPATALASKVLPVPGSPTSRAPLGIFPPSLVYLVGFFKKSTISCTSSFAPSRPATSLKVTLTSLFWSKSLALDFPILKICDPPPPPAPDILLIKNIQRPTSIKSGRKPINTSNHLFSIVLKL